MEIDDAMESDVKLGLLPWHQRAYRTATVRVHRGENQGRVAKARRPLHGVHAANGALAVVARMLKRGCPASSRRP